ncbi:cytochrome b561 and DOMON domain-containing protein At5g48750-like [Punica granatum]|uniref:Uncharacterized protein n=2 Tax=Punica granatum TaxID=22663 RepID=A0A2I0K6P6_PUNGR|nr:cytochrome b561 and DOMON domain-containing protein At5g48750-like [Punica granatum]PKI64217.1 hypothetical protein CRG98_015404 [Punica granatum]
MLGSQAIVAFQNPNGTMNVYTTPINSYNPSMRPGPLSFGVSNVSGVYSYNEMTIFASVGPLENATGVNHVWQAGGSVSSGVPSIHAISGPNLQSMGKIDFLSP